MLWNCPVGVTKKSPSGENVRRRKKLVTVSSINIRHLTVVNDVVYFIGITAENGAELWLFRGESKSPRMVHEFGSGAEHGLIDNLTAYNGKSNRFILK